MSKTIVAMFDSRAEADQAVDLLVDEGFERSEIDVRSSASSTASTSAERDQSWWEWLFGESEDRAHYTEGLGRGGAVVSVTTSDDRADRARMLLAGSGADLRAGAPAEATPGTAQTRASARPARAGEQEDVVPVVEERVRVGKRPVARGGVRVYTRVVERPVEEEVRLRTERVNVERRPVDRPATAGDTAFREDTIEVTEAAEEAVVAKEARVVEEVVVGKDVEERAETVRDTVRKTEVEIQPIGAGTAAGRGIYDRHEDDFQRHWRTIGGGRPYEDYQGAYQFGCELGADARHGSAEWGAVEPEARRRWEERNPRTWDRFKDSVRYSWDRARGTARRAA
jgi:uncharacterized protein (TIGR02271 family)